MRKIDDSPIYNTIIDACISEITNNLVKEDEKALFETVMFTGQEKYLDYFDRITEYIYAHSPDPGHPEWFGHLHRDGTPISYIKGSDWKGPYHNVRAFMQIIELLKQYIPY